MAVNAMSAETVSGERKPDLAASEKQHVTSLFYVTILNVVASFSVVALHTNGIFWTRPTGRLWITSNFIETWFYFAVPIFFMCTGLTLLDYPSRYSTKEYFKKRCSKVVLPFLFWSLFAFALSSFLLLKRGEAVDFNILHIVANIFNSTYRSVYWFFPPLFAIYLAIPVLAHTKEKLKLCKYMAVLGIVFVSTVPQICNLLQISYNSALTPGVISGCMIFPVLGYLCGKMEFKRWQRITIYILGLLGWAVHFAGTILLSGAGEINRTFKGYTNLPAVLQAIAVFVFVRYAIAPLLARHKKVVAIFSWFAKRTFGVYLIHSYFTEYGPGLLGVDRASILWRTVGCVGIFLLSIAITWLLQKVPFLRRIVP